jgi:hypothetical protein
VEIGNHYTFVGGGRSSIETSVEHSYRFYNRSTINLLTTFSISFLGLFFFGRFLNTDRSSLNWKHGLGVLPFVLTFFMTFFHNYKKVPFTFHFNYFIALGLTSGLTLLVIYLISKNSTPQVLDDVLDHP